MTTGGNSGGPEDTGVSAESGTDGGLAGVGLDTDSKPTTDELLRRGAELDGVRIVSKDLPFEPGSRLEKRAERLVALFFLLTFVAGIAFLVIYIAWPWQYKMGGGNDKLYTPLLGITMGLALFGLGGGMIMYVKKLMPHEVAVQERHDGFSAPVDRETTAATLVDSLEVTGITRRPLLKGALGAAGLGAGVVAIAPLGGLIKAPKDALKRTHWAQGVRLVRDDGTPVKPEDMEAGSMETVFPGVKDGNKPSDAPVMLFHLRPDDRVKIRPGRHGWNYGQFFAFSKICTHVGCPVSLYEQQTDRILCPCHQSQFNLLDSCRPTFGPATRSLPQLPIEVDDEGYFVAQSDFHEPVGPAFWERR
jgi:ubiquinol-cytochrome c reductase iron-sulfur subunit